MGMATVLGMGGGAAAAAAPFLDRSSPQRRVGEVLPGHPGIVRRRPPLLLAAAARHRPVRHASPRSLVFSPPAASAGVQRRRVAGTTRAYKATGLDSLLNNEANRHDFDSKRSISPFSTAGFFSKMSFRWMNPLVKKGYQKPLEEVDIPVLGVDDEADTQYSMFMNKINCRSIISLVGNLFMLQEGDSCFWVLCIAQGARSVCWSIIPEGVHQCVFRKRSFQA